MATGRRPARLTLLSRAWCHLCDEMREALDHAGREHRIQVDVIDVDSDPSLESRYGEEVPVLLAEGAEICRHRLDAAKLDAYLAEYAARQARTGQIS